VETRAGHRADQKGKGGNLGDYSNIKIEGSRRAGGKEEQITEESQIAWAKDMGERPRGQDQWKCRKETHTCDTGASFKNDVAKAKGLSSTRKGRIMKMNGGGREERGGKKPDFGKLQEK